MAKYKQKFTRGDIVRVSSSASSGVWGGKPIPKFGAGKKAIVVGSYADQYGTRGGYGVSYTLLFKEAGRASWYDEEDLSLIEKVPLDIFDTKRLK